MNELGVETVEVCPHCGRNLYYRSVMSGSPTFGGPRVPQNHCPKNLGGCGHTATVVSNTPQQKVGW